MFILDSGMAIFGTKAGLIPHLWSLIIVDLIPSCRIAGAKVGIFTYVADDNKSYNQLEWFTTAK